MTLAHSERRSLLVIIALYSTRMLGLFMILPVLSLYTDKIDGLDYAMVGLALGVYGLSQGVFQIPFGMLSDRWGRRRMLLIGLGLFILGSLLAAVADSAIELIVGRAFQGAGAIAGVLLALLSELTAEQNRSKAMASIGASIGASFGLAMVLGPIVASAWGLSGVFVVCAVLGLLGMMLVLRYVPSIQTELTPTTPDVLAVGRLLPLVLKSPELLRLDLSIFALHFIQMAMWVAVPNLLESYFGLQRASHWWFYLLTVGGSFFAMLPIMIMAEKRRKVKLVFIVAILAILLAQILTYFSINLGMFISALFIFFFGFNLQEARLPALLSRIVPAGAKGTAMGIYSSCQFLGVFFGGMAGGWMALEYGLKAVFLLCLSIGILWLLVSLFLKEPANYKSFPIKLDELDTDLLVSLRGFPGVVDITILKEFKEGFIKADMDIFDQQAAEKLLGRVL